MHPVVLTEVLDIIHYPLSQKQHAAILQATFNVVLWIKNHLFCFKFHCNFFVWVRWTTKLHCSDNCKAPNRRQTIISSNDGLFFWRIDAFGDKWSKMTEIWWGGLEFDLMKSTQDDSLDADDIVKSICFCENYCIVVTFTLIFVSNDSIKSTGSATGLEPNMCQAIIWLSDLGHWRISASFGLDAFTDIHNFACHIWASSIDPSMLHILNTWNRSSHVKVFHVLWDITTTYHLSAIMWHQGITMNIFFIGSGNSSRPRQNGRHFAGGIFKCIFLNENVWIPIKILLMFVPKGPINNIPALDNGLATSKRQPLSEPMMVSLPTHICVTWPQWVNSSRPNHARKVGHNCFSWWRVVSAVPRLYLQWRWFIVNWTIWNIYQWIKIQ